MKARVPPAAERQPMVGWFDPGPLVSTALGVVVSTLFGRHSDYRLLEALAAGGADELFDYAVDAQGQPREELWIDYVADTGDGFDSTYAVAYWITRPQLRFAHPDAPERATRCGDVLVLGGDQVYPMASREEYQRRLVAPYRAARAYSAEPAPDVFAVPGNHDWYDSLVSFTRLFCSGRWFQGWRTRQRRSYFALRLPHGWWLCGIDVQLGSDIDAHQVEYFKRVAARMQPGERVILCTAEPSWVYGTVYSEMDPLADERNLAYLERVFDRRGAGIAVFLAGDLHHYRRHANEAGVQKITAGGGGAFLHPTHGPDVRELAGGFTLRASYPEPTTSRHLAWRNLLFPALNPRFGAVMGALYALVGWWWQAGGMGRVLGPALVVAGFVLFTDTHSKWYKRLGGSLHAATHLLAASALAQGGQALADLSGLSLLPLGADLVAAAASFAGGAVIGPLLLGVYLLVSLNLFGRHSNEAFSALRIADWKNFVRLHVARDGSLTILPFGLRRVPRNWREDPAAGDRDPALVPDDAQATAPVAIEAPIHLEAPAAPRPGPAGAADEGRPAVSAAKPGPGGL